MLTKELTNKITDFVRLKPRTVQEVAFFLKKNWRTADRYIETISKETGLIDVRTFREGSRGALKVVFWRSLESAKGSAYQEKLLQEILAGRKKEDFSPLDIYQFVDKDKRKAFLEEKEVPKHDEVKISEILANVKKQVLFFSGNLSWVELELNTYKILEELAKKKVNIKILTKIDITSKNVAEKISSINQRFGWDAIEIRHCTQPLRAMIIDENILSLKEVFGPQYYRKQELAKKTFIFYLIKDSEWIYWMQKVFWHLWERSIRSEDRISVIKEVY